MRSRLLPMALMLILILAGCNPATVDEAEPENGEGEGAAGGHDAVYEEIDGLDPDEREARLLELAEEQGNSVVFYSSLPGAQADAVVAAFEDAYPDINLTLSRDAAFATLTTTLEELNAGASTGDIVEFHEDQMFSLLDEAGEYVVPLESPHRDNIDEAAQYDQWTAMRFTNIVLARNTSLVDDDEMPATMDELTEDRWTGEVVYDNESVFWLMALWSYWEDQGESDEEIRAKFEQLMGGAPIARGNSTRLELTSAGEYSFTPSYTHIVHRLEDEGAPISYEPMTEPLITHMSGFAIMSEGENPAASILLADWLISDGQDVLLETGIDPVRNDIVRQPPEGVEQVFMDADRYMDEFDMWLERYDELANLGESVD
jgi:iron(III) transport system substrate-binding protein